MTLARKNVCVRAIAAVRIMRQSNDKVSVPFKLKI